MSSLASLALIALVCSAAPPAAPSGLDQVLKLLGQQKCDDAFELVAKVEVPNPPTPASLKAAKAVAKGAAACRASDAGVALTFSALALRLAPSEDEVVVAHAEGLMAVQEPVDAAATLDALIAAQPVKKAPKAWMMRAKMAHGFGDYEEAVRLLTSLAAEPATKKEAEPLLATAKEGLEKRKEISFPPPRPDAVEKPLAETKPAETKPAAGRPAAGQVVAVFDGSQIGLGGEQVLKAKLVKGQSYVFKATGQCTRSMREFLDEDGNVIRVKPVDTRGPVFGMDFRVQFGAQDSRSLSAGVGEPDENRLTFVADADEEAIRVFDSSNPGKEVTCTMGQFSVVAQ
ncbi:MAG TPA: hypothetical protein VGK67_05775 [Myxococcales bacterium]|jgi:hypothetical protein